MSRTLFVTSVRRAHLIAAFGPGSVLLTRNRVSAVVCAPATRLRSLPSGPPGSVPILDQLTITDRHLQAATGVERFVTPWAAGDNPSRGHRLACAHSALPAQRGMQQPPVPATCPARPGGCERGALRRLLVTDRSARLVAHVADCARSVLPRWPPRRPGLGAVAARPRRTGLPTARRALQRVRNGNRCLGCSHTRSRTSSGPVQSSLT